MSVCGQSGQTEDDSASEEIGAPVRDSYKQKPASKVVRVLTVLAYLLSVSLAAILLSVYYVCVWKSPVLPPVHDPPELSARRANLTDYADTIHTYNFTGRGDTTVSDAVTESTTVNSSDDYTNTSTDSSVANTSTGDVTPLPNSTSEHIHDETSDGIGTFNQTNIT